jgi:DNA-binding XRE family transcriptional regulator
MIMLSTKQNLALKKLKDLKINRRGSVSGTKVIQCLLEFGRASGNPLGLRMKERRKKLNISQSFLASKLSWSKSRISRVERGFRAISVEDAKKIARILKVTPVWILTGKHT